MIGNTLEEASDLLCAMNFLPETFGRFKIKKKRAVIEYIEPSEAYLKRRKGTVADILLPQASTFTNKVKTDDALVYKGRLVRPTQVIKFSKDNSHNFVLWDGKIITKFKDTKIKNVVAMRPYLDELYVPELVKNVFQRFDFRNYQFRDLITFKEFQKELSLLKPSR